MDSLDVLEATNSIVLNSHESLELPSASLTLVSSPAQALQPTKQSFDSKNERTSWAFAETLPAGSKAIFRVAFKGVLDGSMTGYYKSTWDGGIYTLTQFEVSLFYFCEFHRLFRPPFGRCSVVQLIGGTGARVAPAMWRHSDSENVFRGGRCSNWFHLGYSE